MATTSRQNWRENSRSEISINKTNMASFKFLWFEAITDAVANRTLSPIALSVAVRAARYMGNAPTFYLSHADAARLICRAEATAAEAMRKMAEFGFLVVLVGEDRPPRRSLNGRPATDYRAEIPNRVSYEKTEDTQEKDTSVKPRETMRVSLRKPTPLSPRKPSPIIVEDTVDGSRASSASANSGLVDDITDTIQGGGGSDPQAHEAPADTPCDTPFDDCWCSDSKPVTSDDLDKVEAEEEAAKKPLTTDKDRDSENPLSSPTINIEQIEQAALLLFKLHGELLRNYTYGDDHLFDDAGDYAIAAYIDAIYCDSDAAETAAGKRHLEVLLDFTWQLLLSHKPGVRQAAFKMHLEAIREIAAANPNHGDLDCLVSKFKDSLKEYGRDKGFVDVDAGQQQDRVFANG